jgi:hypothetical protein
MAITAATPITIPKIVSADRSLLEERLSMASRKAWRIVIVFENREWRLVTGDW